MTSDNSLKRFSRGLKHPLWQWLEFSCTVAATDLLFPPAAQFKNLNDICIWHRTTMTPAEFGSLDPFVSDAVVHDYNHLKC